MLKIDGKICISTNIIKYYDSEAIQIYITYQSQTFKIVFGHFNSISLFLSFLSLPGICLSVMLSHNSFGGKMVNPFRALNN